MGKDGRRNLLQNCPGVRVEYLPLDIRPQPTPRQQQILDVLDECRNVKDVMHRTGQPYKTTHERLLTLRSFGYPFPPGFKLVYKPSSL